MIVETQHMPPVARWIGGIVLVPLLAVFIYMAVTTGEWLELGIASIVLCLGVGGMLIWLHMRLEADDRGIHVNIRPIIRIRRTFLWEDLASVSLESAGRNFGGWGIRYAGDGWGYIFGGKQVLKLQLLNGKTRFVTTEHAPEILQMFQVRKPASGSLQQ